MNTDKHLIKHFLGYCKKELGIQSLPNIKFIADKSWVAERHSFGEYSPGDNTVYVYYPNRCTADVFRSLAHELTHHRQSELNMIHHGAGDTGSEIENDANAMAGILLRDYGKLNPTIYDLDQPIKNPIQLREGVTVDGDVLKINVVKTTDHPDDPFVINRERDFFKKMGIPVYYGISPNPHTTLSGDAITDIYDNTKSLSEVDPTDLYKLVLLTAPSIAIDYIITLPSSAKLNAMLRDALKQKYKVSDDRMLNNMSKIEYFIDDMINQEKFAAADPVTQRMAQTWTKSLKKKYGPDAKMAIKKSSNKQTGHPGIQSGARGLLNPVYNLGGEVPLRGKILVVDDFLIGGSTFGEVFGLILKEGVPKENIIAYCLGTKKVM